MIKVTSTNQILPGEKKKFEVSGTIVVVYNLNGNFFATDEACTHKGAPMEEGTITSQEYIKCPWHGSEFDIKTGEVKLGPAEKPLTKYNLEIKENEIYIDI